MSHDPPAPSEPQPSHRVDMRWQGVVRWAVFTGFCVCLAVGLTVLTAVTAVAAMETGEIEAAIVMLALALFFGLLTWPLARMAPRYSTHQGITADGTGITLLQEPERWFPGRTAHIPWPRVRRIGQDVVIGRSAVTHGNTQYFVDIELREPFHDTELPTWAVLDGDTVRIRASKARQGEITQALRATRPDLFPGD